jgi:6,7-dimethyl-8-ribityllumazine synthase
LNLYWSKALRKIEGNLDAANLSFAIVAARWNGDITNRLIDGALQAIVKHGGNENSITIARVPGSFEIPLASRKLALTEKFDAIIAVGTLLKGETDHYQLVANELASGLSRVMDETGVPVTFGVIVSPTKELASERSKNNSDNRGYEAAMAAIEMANLLKNFEEM